MTDNEARRSAEACPACGRYEVALLGFPEISTTGVQPFAELIGQVEPKAEQPPGIGCLACGTEWPDLESFRAAQRRRGEVRRSRRRTR